MSDIFTLDLKEDKKPPTRWSKSPSGAEIPQAGETFFLEFLEPPSALEDIVKTIAARGTAGAAILAGLPATIGQGVEYVQEKLGFPITDKTPEQAAGEQARFLGIPGTTYPTQKAFEYNLKDNLPFTEYDPFFKGTQFAGTVAEAVTTSVPGKLLTLPQRVTTGIVSGLGTEAAGQLAEAYGPEGSDVPARFLGGIGGSLVGSLAAKQVRFFTQGNQEVEKRIVESLASDFRSDPNKLKQVQEAAASGAKINLLDMAGPETRSLIAEYAGKSPRAQQILGNISANVAERTANAIASVSGKITSAFGRRLDAPLLEATEKSIGQKARDIVYDIARNQPEAQDIFTVGIQQLSQSNTIKKIMADVAKKATDPDSEIIPPTAGSPAVKSAIFDQNGKPIMLPATQGTGGNLIFWDQVKIDLDDAITAADLSGARGEMRRLMGLKNRLLTELDNAVPQYGLARDLASETFGAASAPRAGYNFVKNISIWDGAKVANALRKYTPENRKLFQEGAAASVQDMIETKGVTHVAKLMNFPMHQQRMRLALGDNIFDSINGRVQAENLLSKTQGLQAMASGSSQLPPVFGGAVGTALTAGVNALESGAIFSPDPRYIFGLIAGSAVGKGGQLVFSARQQALANKLLTLASSGDEKQILELGRLAKSKTEVRELLDKLNTSLEQATLSYARAMQPPSYETALSSRESRASGGRTSSSAAEALLRDLKRRKVMMANKTEKMLALPDDAVVQALDAAKR